jgi:hypothetical protein
MNQRGKNKMPGDEPALLLFHQSQIPYDLPFDYTNTYGMTD